MSRKKSDAEIKKAVKTGLDRLWKDLDVRAEIGTDVEFEWFNMLPKLEALSDPFRKKAFASWFEFGYFIFDRRKNVGAALRCLLSVPCMIESSQEDRANHSAKIFLYAAFVAEDEYVAYTALRDLIALVPGIKKATVNRTRLLVLDYLRHASSRQLPTVFASAIVQFMGKAEAHLEGQSIAASDLQRIVGRSRLP